MGIQSAFGSSKTMHVSEGFGPEAFTWNNANLAATYFSADSWFDAYGPTQLAQTLTAQQLGDDQEASHREVFAQHLFGDNAINVIPELEIDLAELGEPKTIEKTKLGKALLKVLDAKGVTWNYNDRKPVTHDTYIDWPLQDEGIAQWLNQFDMPVMQRFKVYVDAKGKETLVWSAAILVATREYLHEKTRFLSEGDDLYTFSQSESYLKNGGITFGQWSEKFYIPAVAKSLFFLAETPFPSTTIMAMPRTMAYSDVDPAKHPRPFISFVRDDFIVAPYGQNLNGYQWEGSFFPTIVHAGWLVTKENIDEIETFLPVFTDGLNRITTILDDGYLNHKTLESAAPFDELLLSACVFDRSWGNGSTCLGHSQWVPTTRIGILLNETRIKFDEAIELLPDRKARELLWSCQDDGAGPLVAAAANNLIWYFFMPDLQEYPSDLPVAERIMLQANRLKIKDDSVNALSNLGILNYMARNYDRAIELFELVLADEDDYSDNEANFYLAHIYELLGESKKAAKHKAALAAGPQYDYELQPQITEKSAKEPPALAKSGLGQVNRFCTSCGQEFTEASAKFCTSCGQSR